MDINTIRNYFYQTRFELEKLDDELASKYFKYGFKKQVLNGIDEKQEKIKKLIKELKTLNSKYPQEFKTLSIRSFVDTPKIDHPLPEYIYPNLLKPNELIDEFWDTYDTRPDVGKWKTEIAAMKYIQYHEDKYDYDRSKVDKTFRENQKLKDYYRKKLDSIKTRNNNMERVYFVYDIIEYLSILPGMIKKEIDLVDRCGDVYMRTTNTIRVYNHELREYTMDHGRNRLKYFDRYYDIIKRWSLGDMIVYYKQLEGFLDIIDDMVDHIEVRIEEFKVKNNI